MRMQDWPSGHSCQLDGYAFGGNATLEAPQHAVKVGFEEGGRQFLHNILQRLFLLLHPYAMRPQTGLCVHPGSHIIN